MTDHAVYTRGSIGGTMLRNAVGMVAGTLAMSGYNLADAYFVGQLPGATPLAAIGFTFPVIMLVSCLFRGVAIGMTATAAHALGARNHLRAVRLVTSGLLLMVIVSFLLALAGMATVEPLFALFGAKGETLALVGDYMNVWYLGCVTASLAMAGNDLLLTVGAPKTASLLMIVGMLLNVGLDPLFIFGWGPVPAMGIRGAALATVLSQGVATVLVLTVLWRKYELIRFRRLSARQLRALWGVIIRFGIPATLGMLMMPLGSAVLTWVTASFGDAAVAATATAARLEGVAFVLPMAFGMTMVSVVGQNYGARLYSRIRQCRRFAMRFSLYYLTAMAVLYFLFSGGLVRLFTEDEGVREIMALCLRIVPWGFAFIEIHRFSTFVFTGCGRPGPAAWLNALRIAGLLIPFSLVALYFRSLPGLFIARLAADVLAGTIGWILSRRMTQRLPEDGQPPNRLGLPKKSPAPADGS